MRQIAASELGLPVQDISFELGNSDLPKAPVEGGSFTVSSVGSAIRAASRQLREALIERARRLDDSPFAEGESEGILITGGRILSNPEAMRGVDIRRLFAAGEKEITAEAAASPSEARSSYSCYAHSAIFAEVEVDTDFGTIRVPRVVMAVAGGAILNPKTARSQILGGIVWGIGMALEEEAFFDHRFGRVMNHDFAEYHIPVNADIHDIDVLFVPEQDDIVNPLGAKGLGEIGVVGVAAAIGNAVWHATGTRIRSLPITPDKILEALPG